MADQQASEKIELSEVMLAMDVVDTLRHERSLVDRELQSEDREAELIAKLRKIYADQGLAVSDEVIAEGVKAMREDRFTYQPPPAGLQTMLARLYVDRGRWVKRIAVLGARADRRLDCLPVRGRHAGRASSKTAGRCVQGDRRPACRGA
jgi:hypothetical protein